MHIWIEFMNVKIDVIKMTFELWRQVKAGLILGLHQANEGRRYFVTTSLVDWTRISIV